MGYWQLPSTALVNQSTGRIVYTPPQGADEVERLMVSLEAFINGPAKEAFDPLVCMALIHHQFESIHPFYDANGRTGRIINVLYLVKRGLLDIPVLYLSRYLIRTKEEYYRRLQEVREGGDWSGWLLYFLKGVEKTARFTLAQIQAIRDAQMSYKHADRGRPLGGTENWPLKLLYKQSTSWDNHDGRRGVAMSDGKKSYKVTVREGGPYVVSGGVPLGEKVITAQGNIHVFTEGRSFPASDSYELCRCGKSSAKPFCDGTHEGAGFTGTETASKLPYAERAELQVGPTLDLLDDHR